MSKIYKKHNLTRKEIPSLIITREFLAKLSNIIEDSITNNEYRTISFKLVRNNEVMIRNNSMDFLKYYITNNVKAIEMVSACDAKNIKIKIDFRKSSSSEYIISGNDPEWVNELTERIEHLLKINVRKNDLFHSGLKKPLIIYSGLALIISYPVTALLVYNILVSDFKLYMFVFGVLISPSLIGFHFLFKRLSPKYVVKDDL
jgi:hypothetical protein